MSKRKTTGMPKSQRRQQRPEEAAAPANEGLFSRYINETTREADLQRLVTRGVIAVGGLLVLLIAIAILWEQVIIPTRPVAVVNNETITVREFQERVRVERTILIQQLNNALGLFVGMGLNPDQLVSQEPYATWWQEISQQPELLGSRVLDDMIEEQIVRQEAAERGIAVDEAAIEEQIEEFFNFVRPTEEPAEPVEPTETPTPSQTPTPFVSPTPSPSPSPTALPTATATPLVEATAGSETAAEAADPTPTLTPVPSSTPTSTPTFEEREGDFQELVNTFYTNARREGDLSREAVRAYFEYQALLAALQETVTEAVTRETTYVDARHILVATEEDANDIIGALNAGESFADIARAASTDSSAARGGELDWAPASNYVPEFQQAVLDAELGSIVGPVQSDFGYHVIQVRSREEREMDDNEFEQAKAIAFNQWLEEATSEEANTIDRRDNWPDHVPDNPAWVYRPTGIDIEATPN